jgi:xanthine/uracil permease
LVGTCGLLLLGILPKIGQVVANVPGPVIGGAATVMFAMVTAVGIQTLHKTSFDGNHNLLIVAVSLAAGLIPAVQPDFCEHFPSDFQVIFGSDSQHRGGRGDEFPAGLSPRPRRRWSRTSRRPRA